MSTNFAPINHWILYYTNGDFIACCVGMGIWALFSSFSSSWVVGLPQPCRHWWENWYLVIRMHFVCNNVRTIPFLLWLLLLYIWFWAAFLLYVVSLLGTFCWTVWALCWTVWALFKDLEGWTFGMRIFCDIFTTLVRLKQEASDFKRSSHLVF